MTQNGNENEFRAVVDTHLSRFIDGDIIDQDHYESVVSAFEDGILNAYRNGLFNKAMYNKNNRSSLTKLLSILKKIDELELNLTVLQLIESGTLPRNVRIPTITDDDKRLVATLRNLLDESNAKERLEPFFNETIQQLKPGKSNVAAAMIVDECSEIWQLLSNQVPPKYISEYDHPFLQFVQAIFDEVLGFGAASARTYFK